MIAVDTNLLVYAHRASTPQHLRARAALENAAADRRGWGIAAPCVAEFWSTVTHPAVKKPSTTNEASEFIRSLLRDGEGKVWLPALGFEDRLLECASDLEVTGGRIFDLQIALTALENGATVIWTHDENFIRIPGLRVQFLPLQD